MSLTKDDRDIVELIATKVAEKFGEAQSNAMQVLIEHHQSTCPHGRQLFASKKFVLGMMVGLGALSAGGSAVGSVLMKVLTGP